MVAMRACKALREDGGRCQSPPLLDGDFCLMHSPEHAEEMAEARRLGGLRRRREKAVSGAYAFEGLADVGQVRRLLEVAALDTLSLENSVARSRTLAYLAQVAWTALEVGQLADRIDALERLVAPRLAKAAKRR